MWKAVGRSLLRGWARIGMAPALQYRACNRLWPHLWAGQALASRLPNGCRMWCDLADHIERCIWFEGLYEPIESALFCRSLRPGMTVLDVGANVGQYTLLAAPLVGPSGRIHAFEPVARNFAKLKLNVEVNGLDNTQLNRVALWHEDGEVAIEVPPDSVNDAGTYRVVPGRASAVTAPARRLDDYVREHDIERVDFIKIDIEGGEPFFLQGARQTLERDHPLILAEVNRPALQAMNTSVEQYWSLLAALGYRAWCIRIEPDLCGPLPNLDEVDLENVLFHREDLPSDITTGLPLKAALRWAQSGW